MAEQMTARQSLEVMVRTDRGRMTVWTPAEVQDALDRYRDEVLAEARDETVEWLLKKADEYFRHTGSRHHTAQAEAISLLADKAARGAIRVFLEAGEGR